MGGTALGFRAERMNKQQYSGIVSNIESVGKNWGMAVPPKAILSYRNKESHGDIDFLYSGSITDVENNLRKEYQLHETVYENGPVCSFGIICDGLTHQVDFIRIPVESYAFAYNYFSWNDLGNLIGRVAHRVGLEFAHNGVFLVNRFEDNPNIKLGDHLVTNDFFAAIDYLDLDTARYRQGFDNLEDIFEFVVQSKYFDYSSVDIERRNHVARIRDKKRPSYTAFIQWLKNNRLDVDRIDLPPKESFREQHFLAWPHLKSEYNTAQDQYKRELEIKAKFNGHVVAGITKLSGKELGAFMTHCRGLDWFSSVEQLTQEQIAAKIAISWINYSSV